jgi:hypothetical protein
MKTVWSDEQEMAVGKVVKREEGCGFAEVIENAAKINFKKCPKHPLHYDILVL